MTHRRQHVIARSTATLGLLLLATASCGNDGSGTTGGSTTGNTAPTSTASTAPTSTASTAPTSTASTGPSGGLHPEPEEIKKWQRCVAPLTEGDPRGQGREILGVGFFGKSDDPKSLVTADQFDLSKVTLEDGTPIQDVQVADHALTGKVTRAGVVETIEGEKWNKAVFVGKVHCVSLVPVPDAWLSIRARITAAAKNDGAPDKQHPLNGSWVYTLELEGAKGYQAWGPACHGEAGSALASADSVIPVPGSFDLESKTYTPDTKTFSFACMKKAAAKCEGGGYVADDSKDTSGEKRELFQACTRMMTGDYCGTGSILTCDGSKIDTWDNRNVSTQDTASVASFGFEAGWTSKGAVCVDHLRWDPAKVGSKRDVEKAKCLEELQKATNKCSSQADAEKKAPGKPVLFNKSCTKHPCGDEHARCPLDTAPPGPH